MDTANPMHPLLEIIHGISQQLEAGHVDAAREMCAEVIDAVPPVAVIPAMVNFEAAFRTACRKNDVQECCYVKFQHEGEDRMTMKTGGDLKVAAIITELITHGMAYRRHMQQHHAEQVPKEAQPNRIIIAGG